MQKPSLGRIVLAVCPQAKSNGADVAPAVITRVWNEHPTGGWSQCDGVAGRRHAGGRHVGRLVEDEEAARQHGFAAFWSAAGGLSDVTHSAAGAEERPDDAKQRAIRSYLGGLVVAVQQAILPLAEAGAGTSAGAGLVGGVRPRYVAGAAAGASYVMRHLAPPA
jgi:hypothetical protein